MAAAECVYKVYSRRIVRLISRLNTALSHHCVGVAYAQLCNYHSFSAGVIRLNSGRSTRAAAADYKHVNIICNVV